MPIRIRERALVTSAFVVSLWLSGSAAAQVPVEWSAKLASPASSVKPGSKVMVDVSVQIDSGWHIYSLTQGPGGPVPTRITLPEGQPFRLAGTIQAPKPASKFDEAFGVIAEYYEIAVTFPVPVEVGLEASPGPAEIRVDVLYMVCNAKQCLPKKTVKLSADAVVKKKGAATVAPGKAALPQGRATPKRVTTAADGS